MEDDKLGLRFTNTNFPMDASSKISGVIPPAQEKAITSKESTGQSENLNPNVSIPGLKLPNSPLINQLASPRKKLGERKFSKNKESDGAEEELFRNRGCAFDGVTEIAEMKGVKSFGEGCGKVMRLIKEFENLMNPKLGGVEEVNYTTSKWRLCGFKHTTDASETQVPSSSFCPSDFVLTAESLGLDSSSPYQLDSVSGRISTGTSAGGRKTRPSGIKSSGNGTRRHWKRKPPKATSQKPFMLRTEERGRWKEVEFMKKLRQRMEEEEKKWIPIAQGLPWTTDEPERLVKPAVKETTRPVDLALHSDVRAVERSEFDNQVAAKMNTIEQYRMERERQQKLQEEEEIRQLRKELVFKAQQLPFFDRPFIPKKSGKHLTIPKEPKFHVPQLKKRKCCLSLQDFHAHPQ